LEKRLKNALTKLKEDSTNNLISPNPFKKQLIELSNNLKEQEWKNMMNIFDIPEGRKEKIGNSFDFLNYLLEVGYFSINNMEPLQKLLIDIGRNDLSNSLINK
jgi:Death effector domain